MDKLKAAYENYKAVMSKIAMSGARRQDRMAAEHSAAMDVVYVLAEFLEPPKFEEPDNGRHVEFEGESDAVEPNPDGRHVDVPVVEESSEDADGVVALDGEGC